MTYSPIRPIPPKDFAARALGPLDPSKSDDCINSANKQLRASNEISAGQSRASCMASYPIAIRNRTIVGSNQSSN